MESEARGWRRDDTRGWRVEISAATLPRSPRRRAHDDRVSSFVVATAWRL
jgi:hypothetical protein